MENNDLQTLTKQLMDVTKTLSTVLEKEGMLTKDPAANMTNAPLHGPRGLWSGQGIDQNVISTLIHPIGLAEHIPAYGSVYTDPRFATFTGVQAAIGSEAATPCTTGPTTYAKGCMISAQFGRKIVSSQTIDMKEVGLKLNRGDMTDLRLINPSLFSSLAPNGIDKTNIMDVVSAGEFFNMATMMERWMAPQLWTGSPANNNAGGGYREFPGLDNQIVTGIVDADTNTTCPALDSDVKNFNYNDVEGTTLDIVDYLSEMEHYLTAADRGQRLVVNRALVMRPDLFFILCKIWPCRYLTNSCSNMSGTNVMVVNDKTNSDMQWNLFRSKKLPINGTEYPVILDDGIFEHNSTNNASVAAGCFASSIYFVPLSANGIPMTYIEYVDYTKSNLDIAFMNGTQQFWHTDNGRYFWSVEQHNTCVLYNLVTEPRIVLRAPQLAGKIQRIRYCPLQHQKDWDMASSYAKDGGVSTRSYASRYSVWGNR